MIKYTIFRIAFALCVACTFSTLSLADEAKKLPETPPLLIVSAGLGEILDDVQFLLREGKSEDSFELFNGILVETFSPGVHYSRPISFQVYDLLSDMNLVFNLPLEENVYLHLNDVLVVDSPSQREIDRGQVKKMSGLAAFLYSLEQGDFASKATAEDKQLYEFYKSASGYLRHFGVAQRAAIGGKEAVNAKLVPDSEIRNVLGEDLFAFKLDTAAYEPGYLESQFSKFKEKTMKELKPLKGESDALFQARRTLTEASFPALEEMYLQIASAKGGFRIDRDKKVGHGHASVTATPNSTLATNFNQLGKIPSAFHGVDAEDTVQFAHSALPVTQAQREAISAMGVYEQALVRDTFAKGGVEYWVPKKIKEGEKPALEKKFTKLKFSKQAMWFLQFNLDFVVQIMDNALAKGSFDSVLKTIEDEDARYSSAMGIQIQDAKAIRAFLEKVATNEWIDLDAIAIEDGTIHRIEVPADIRAIYPEVYDEADSMYLAEVKLKNGATTVWYASGKDAPVFLQSVIAEANSTVKPAIADPLVTDFSLAPFVSTARRQLADYNIPEGRTEQKAVALAENSLIRYAGQDRIQTRVKVDNGVPHMEMTIGAGALKTFGRLFGYFVDDALDE